MLPLDLTVSPDGILKWLSNRSIPKNREAVAAILTSLGLRTMDIKGVLDICMGLSLNDSYWVPQSDFKGSFREYNLFENRYGMLASKCPLFTDMDTSFIPIGRIVKEGGIEACLDYYRELGDDYYQELVSMLVFDAVILNEDRHFGNFGLMRDNHTGEIVGPAPIFDNGLSLLCYVMKQDFADDRSFQNYMYSRSNPYGPANQFMDLASRIIGPKQKEQLRRLLNFTFEESDVTNLPSWRTGRLEEMIRQRARELLKA